MMLHASVPAMRQPCGLRKTRRRRYISRGATKSFRRQQRDGQDALLGSHAAVQERSAIPALILAQLRRVDEETVRHCEQRVGAESPPRETQQILVREQQRLLRTLGAQVLAELVAEVRGRVPLGKDRCRRLAVNGPVIAR